MAAGVGVVRLLAVLVEPYMPATSAKVLAMLGLQACEGQLQEVLQGAAAPHKLVAPGTALGPVEHLFKTISDDTIAELRARWVLRARASRALGIACNRLHGVPVC